MNPILEMREKFLNNTSTAFRKQRHSLNNSSRKLGDQIIDYNTLLPPVKSSRNHDYNIDLIRGNVDHRSKVGASLGLRPKMSIQEKALTVLKTSEQDLKYIE